MNFARVFLIGGILAVPTLVRAVYAPIPEPELSKDWTVTLRGGVTHDSNIFGSQTNEIASVVYEAAPKLAFNASLSDQTFASASYELILDHFDNRPGDKTLDSHNLVGRLAHAFTADTTIDISDTYQIARNPESLLSGLVVNTDQSFKRNELDARFGTSVTEKSGVDVKFRSVNYRYENATLATNLDHTENLYGLSGNYAFLPETKFIGEYRHEDIDYRTGGSTKDKKTDFAIGGVDYAVAKKMSLSARLGYQWRDRSSEKSSSAPYAELSLKYDYATLSYFTLGYEYTFEETSNVALYNDTKVNRFFFNVQHALSALVVASGSIDYEPSQLQSRGAVPNVDETTTRFGAALTWLPLKNWSISATYDYDKVDSDDPSRGQNRERYGINASYTF